MGLPVGFVFTHDSLMVGEDGPTHQPIEHAAALRLIPNLEVWRPADAAEVAVAWSRMLTRKDGPVAILLTRQGVEPTGYEGTHEAMKRGGYVVSEPAENAAATVIATGAEVGTVAQAAKLLADRGLHIRIVSMPSIETFLRQEVSWRQAVLPANASPVFAVEMGRPESWCQFTGNLDHVIGVQRFGASAPGKVIAERFGFTAEGIADSLTNRLA